MVRLERSAAGKAISPNAKMKFRLLVDGDVLLERTTNPLTKGARALLALGYNPDLLMTVRVKGRDYDSFKPVTIGDAAKWSVNDTDTQGLRRIAFQPYSRA